MSRVTCPMLRATLEPQCKLPMVYYYVQFPQIPQHFSSHSNSLDNILAIIQSSCADHGVGGLHAQIHRCDQSLHSGLLHLWLTCMLEQEVWCREKSSATVGLPVGAPGTSKAACLPAIGKCLPSCLRERLLPVKCLLACLPSETACLYRENLVPVKLPACMWERLVPVKLSA